MFVFGRNLYETDETNSILEIRLAQYCPMFEEMESSFLTVDDCIRLRVVTLIIHSVFLAAQIPEKSNRMCTTK